MLAAALSAAELEMRPWRCELVLAAPHAASSRQWPRNVASLHSWALSGFQLARGEVDAARHTIEAALAVPRSPTYGGLLLSRLAELELEQGRDAEAERALRRLVETTAAHVTPWATTTLHRTIGLVRGDVDALVEAARQADDAGLVFEQARAHLALGERDPSSVERLVDAHHTFARLGAHGLRRVAARRLHQLGAKVPRARSRADGLLTESEEQVARLVQQGMRNRDIAATLHQPRSIEVSYRASMPNCGSPRGSSWRELSMRCPAGLSCSGFRIVSTAARRLAYRQGVIRWSNASSTGRVRCARRRAGWS